MSVVGKTARDTPWRCRAGRRVHQVRQVVASAI